MCTVTIVPRTDGFRLLCNRDEGRMRPEALDPRVDGAGDRRAIFPIDPVGGGTWIGVNDAGLALTLLNRTATPPSAAIAASSCSRGRIIPPLLRYEHLGAAFRAAARAVLSRFAPFRLVIVQNGRCGVISSNGRSLTTELFAFNTPLMFTSSSLGDAGVDAPRRHLFEELVARHPRGWIGGQRLFHEHRWPNRPDLSVMMERADARTVSRTIVDVTSRSVAMDYESFGSGRLERHRSGSRRVLPLARECARSGRAA